MSVKVISFTPWRKAPATGAHFRIVEVDACPNCRKRNALATHHVGEPTANCHACYLPFECPPPPRRNTSGLH